MPSYAELHCLSNFTFLRGASHPEELVTRAASLGYSGLALTDECSVAGVVRAHVAARTHALSFIVGTELRLTDGPKLVLLAMSRAGYGGLCELISKGRRAAVKGSYRLSRNDLASGALDDCLALWLPEERPVPSDGEWLSGLFPERCWIAVELLATGRDRDRLATLTQLGARLHLRCVASGDVHMHVRGRRALQDTLTAIRLKTTVAGAGLALLPNGERHLRRLASLERVYPTALLEESIAIAQRCRFSLDELRYEYPQELVPEGETPASHLRKLTEEGQRIRWPEGVPDSVRTQIEHELELIAELRYEPFFLTVHDLVRFARSHEILCQGRGSAANSAVCYCLGITAVDPGA
jgi:error-prone DNA polymerase